MDGPRSAAARPLPAPGRRCASPCWLREGGGDLVEARRTGDGPDVVLVHGPGQASQNFTRLAAALSGQFPRRIATQGRNKMTGPTLLPSALG